MTRTAVLLHGVTSTHTTWWRASRDLTDLGWDVHALDLLGHGGRTARGPITLDALAEDVIAQLAERGLTEEPADLVIGHSLGAVVALDVAGQHPGFARRIVLEDPPGLPPTETHAEKARVIAADHARATADPAAEIAARLAANPSWAPRDAEFSVQNLLSCDLPAITEFLETSAWDLPQLVKYCPLPITLLAATEPGTALAGTVRADVMLQLGPDVRVIESGHCIHRDRPALWLLTALEPPAATA